MKEFLICVVVIAAVVGGAVWYFQSKFKRWDAAAAERGYEIELRREDAPAFRRTYTKRLDSRAVIEVEYRTGYGRRSYGELTQPGGAHIYFDPDNVADKIIDPTLVPLVEATCEDIAKLDAAFIDSKPSQFTDENGTIWKRGK